MKFIHLFRYLTAQVPKFGFFALEYFPNFAGKRNEISQFITIRFVDLDDMLHSFGVDSITNGIRRAFTFFSQCGGVVVL
jgi:hypothetical protein